MIFVPIRNSKPCLFCRFDPNGSYSRETIVHIGVALLHQQKQITLMRETSIFTCKIYPTCYSKDLVRRRNYLGKATNLARSCSRQASSSFQSKLFAEGDLSSKSCHATFPSHNVQGHILTLVLSKTLLPRSRVCTSLIANTLVASPRPFSMCKTLHP